MDRPLRVLALDTRADSNVCGVYRNAMYVPYLADLGVEVRYALPSFESEQAAGAGDPVRAVREGASDFEHTELAWADVILLRRAYQTHLLCLDCEFESLDAMEAHEHEVASRHTVEIGPHFLLRPLLERMRTDPGCLGARAIVYDTDDELFDIPSSNAYRRLYSAEADLIEGMIRTADLVTVSTPVLAARLRPYNEAVRVVRNAIDPAWYETPVGSAAEPVRADGYPRILYYGSVGRMRHYAVCRDAVDETARRFPGTRRIWLGAPELREQWGVFLEVVDEVRPYVLGVPAFAAALKACSPDIGLAPVLGDAFDRAKSELHWLEYSMVGAVTVASRTMKDGPYHRVIRHGVDGFVAHGKSEWADALRRVASSRALRDEIAGRARERVLGEYTAARRSAEWADAFRWAADRAGRGRAAAQQSARAVSLGGLRPASARAAGRAPISAARGGSVPAAPGPAGPARAAPAPAASAPAAPGPAAPARAAPAPAASAPAASAPAASPQGSAAAQPLVPDPAELFASYVAAQAFADRSPLRLNLGCGSVRLDGFVNIDRVGTPELRLNPAFGLPFADGTVSAIYGWQVVDDAAELARVFACEAARVMRAGGVVRLIGRDREAAVRRRDRLASQGIVLTGDAARVPPFDSATLQALLADAGFADVQVVDSDESRDPALRGLESRRGIELSEDAVILEATR